jgi:hypothetical protein
MTGSGKTFLAKAYLSGYDNVIVLDTKEDFSFEPFLKDDQYTYYYTLSELQEHKQGIAIYRPIVEEMNEDSYDDFFKWVYRRKNTIVYVDEVVDVARSSLTVPFYAKAIIQKGRSRNTAMWASTQRPKNIPIIFMSEATHYFIFALKMSGDRERLYEVIQDRKILEPLKKEKHEFWYYTDTMETPRKAVLKPIRSRRNKTNEIRT